MPKIRVDGKEIETKQGTTLLQACLDNDIYIPNLCFLESMEDPSASCRMCFVEIEGEKQPITSCTVNVKDDMVVKTDTPCCETVATNGPPTAPFGSSCGL